MKTTWMAFGCLVALAAGLPAVADDTELLLVNPDPTSSPKPNVVFILDTSGSMGDDVETTLSYDSSHIYPTMNDCDPNRMYWTDVDIVPECTGNDNYIEKAYFFCQYAANEIAGLGYFSNTMVQYRAGGADGMSGGQARWQTLAPGYHTSAVECQNDSGTHGDGTTGYLWAANGTNLANPFTNDPNGELAWGSAPRNISYTFYDGNYLNYRQDPQTQIIPKIDVLKTVTKQVLTSISNINVGLMRFNPDIGNDSEGGSVIHALSDLDTNRTNMLTTIDGLPDNGYTPLAETMYENALYWRSLGANFGTVALTDSNALATASPMVYETHDWDSCAKNFNILITDGTPREDEDAPGLVNSLPNFGAAACDNDRNESEGYCLDDIAQYLATEDVSPTTDGDQFVTTYTIGFATNFPLLVETAADAEGEYYMADDISSLTKALLNIIADINDRSLSFAAPAVSVNTFNRTQNLNDLYITTFGARNNVHWPGNLKKYRISDNVIVDDNGAAAVDPTTGFFLDTALSDWTTGGPDGNEVRKGGAAQQLPPPASRNLYTNNTSGDLTGDGGNEISASNEAAFSDADFGLTGAAGEPTKTELIRWTLGEDVIDEDNNPLTTVRKVMGDPLHSQPAAVVYGGSAANPEVVIYTATNDGYLHAIDGATGSELWAFIPKSLLSRMTRLHFDPETRYKQYGLDGNVVPVVKDVDLDGTIEPNDGDWVQLIFGMRRGGNTYFSLDVTDKTAPELMWTISLPSMGESWSTPVVARIDIGSPAPQNTDKAVMVVGGGYDTVHDTAAHPAANDAVGASVHFFDLKSGAELWRGAADTTGTPAGVAKSTIPGLTRSIPNEVRVVDLSGDGYADRMYATDMGGQILRFDIINGGSPSADNELVTGGVIAQLGGEGLATPTAADTRRFYNAPDVALITDNVQQRRFLAINVGSGYRAHPFDLSAADRFYSLRDANVFNQLTQLEYNSYTPATDGDLVDVSGQTQVVVTAADAGWKFTLPNNEKILADSLTFNDEVFFVSFTPDSLGASTCSAGQGTNFLYRVSAINGDPIVPNISSLDPGLSDAERRTTLSQGGIAPSPTILFPSPDPNCTGEDCNQPPLGCVGVECFDPGFENNPVRTLWTQDGIE